MEPLAPQLLILRCQSCGCAWESLQSGRVSTPWEQGGSSRVSLGAVGGPCCAHRLVCITASAGKEVAGAVTVEVPGRGRGVSEHLFAYQDPKVLSISPARGPRAGGTRLTLHGSSLLTGRLEDIRVVVGDQPCCLLPEPRAERLQCETGPQHTPAVLPVAVWFGAVEQRLQSQFQYTADPNVTSAGPTKSFVSGGRVVRVRGQNLDVVQTPRMRVAVQALQPSEGQEQRRRVEPEAACSLGACSGGRHFEEPCLVASSRLITCPTPALPGLPTDPWVRVEFILDNLVFDFTTLSPTPFSYEADPTLQPLNPEDPTRPFRHKPGSVLSVEVPFLLGRGDPGPSCGRAVLLFVAEGGWHAEGRRQRGCPA